MKHLVKMKMLIVLCGFTIVMALEGLYIWAMQD